jgi:hypothetical protein
MEKKIVFNINTCKHGFPYCVAPLNPKGPWREQTLIYIMSESFNVNKLIWLSGSWEKDF